MTHVSPNTTNAAFRLYDDDVAGAITAQTALAAANTNATIDVDVKFHAVLRWNETAGADAPVTGRLEYNLNGAGWNDVTTGTPIQSVAPTNCTTANNNQYATNAAGLADGTTVERGLYNTDAADEAANTLNSSSDEVAYCLQIDSAQVADNDTIQLRISDAGTALNADTTIVTITVNEAVSYTLTADGGTYNHTGTAATLQADRNLVAGATAFSLGGTAATLQADRKLAAGAATFSLAGTDATVTADRTLTAGAATFTLTGTAANFARGFSMAADGATFSLAGTAATLTADRTLSAAPGTLTLTGTAATLAYGRVMPAGAGSYSLGGTAATFPLGFSMAADAGSFTLTGTAAGVTVGRTLTAAAGSYALSGTDATLTYTPAAPTLTAESGSYTLSGTDATLTYTPAAASLNAEPGAYILTGTDAALKVDRTLQASSGSYAFAGATAGLASGLRLNAESGAYTLTGARGKIYYTPIGTEVLAEKSYFPSPALRSAAVAASDRASYIEVRNKDSEAA